MPAIARGQASNCSNPEIDVFTKVNGVPTDVDSLEFIIFEDVTNPGTPIQVFPVAGRSAVNTDLCSTGQKITTGRYVALYTPPLTEPIGTHIVQWFFKLTPTSPEQSFSEDFEVLAEVTGSPTSGYCTVQQLRDAGVTTTQADDSKLQELIADASRMIDKFTGRFFEPRTLTIRIDGTGRPGILLGDPIISISEIQLISDDTNPPVIPLALDDVRIYNRHISQNLLNPDDRESPKIEFLMFDEREERLPLTVHHIFHPHRWPRGTQNVEITGIFGYTDPNGTPNGKTPLQICIACQLIVIRFLLEPFATSDGDAGNAWRVIEHKTRDQTIKFADPSKLGSAGVGAFTGDPQIDRIIAQYTRPPAMGAT